MKKINQLVITFLREVFLPFQPIEGEEKWVKNLRRTLHVMNSSVIPLFSLSWIFVSHTNALGFLVLYCVLYTFFLQSYFEAEKHFKDVAARKMKDEIYKQKFDEMREKNRS